MVCSGINNMWGRYTWWVRIAIKKLRLWLSAVLCHKCNVTYFVLKHKKYYILAFKDMKHVFFYNLMCYMLHLIENFHLKS